MMLIYYFGFFSGVLLTWIWLTEASPMARKSKERSDAVNVLCSHCGRMYTTSHSEVRTANYCNQCK